MILCLSALHVHVTGAILDSSSVAGVEPPGAQTSRALGDGRESWAEVMISGGMVILGRLAETKRNFVQGE